MYACIKRKPKLCLVKSKLLFLALTVLHKQQASKYIGFLYPIHYLVLISYSDCVSKKERE